MCWLLSEDLSPPSSAVLQVLQMMVVHGGRKTCRVDRFDHKVKNDITLSAPSLAQVNLVVLYANYNTYQHITMILYISKGHPGGEG